MARELSNDLRSLGVVDESVRVRRGEGEAPPGVDLGYEDEELAELGFDETYTEDISGNEDDWEIPDDDVLFSADIVDDSPPPRQMVPPPLPVIQAAAMGAALKGLQDQINQQAVLVGRISEILMRYMNSMQEAGMASAVRITDLEGTLNGVTRVIGGWNEIVGSQQEEIARASHGYHKLATTVVQALESIHVGIPGDVATGVDPWQFTDEEEG